MELQKVFLIVDDDTDDCDLFCKAVKAISPLSQCRVAENGEHALLLLRNHIEQIPDFIFLDLNMPRMDGKSCLSELKKDELLKGIPVVIFTTSSDPKDIKETRDLGAVHFITKPYEFKQLIHEIKNIVSKF